METLVLSSLEIVESPFTRYELPRDGISMLGYMIRRLHKTAMLAGVERQLAAGEFAPALCQIATYAAATAGSYGSLYYEPRPDEVGAAITEMDPETGALVTATLLGRQPVDHYSGGVRLPDGSRCSGSEKGAESKINLRGWMLPADSHFTFLAADESYRAELAGVIVREIVPRLVGPWHMRTCATLELSDSAGNHGRLELQRNAQLSVTISGPTGRTLLYRQLQVS